MRDQDRIAKFREKLAHAIAYEGYVATEDIRLGEFNCVEEYHDITFDDLVTFTTAVDEQQSALLALVQQWREKAREYEATHGFEGEGYAIRLNECADQLERLITGEGK